MPNPWVTLLVTIIGSAFTVVLFPLARDYLKRRWMPKSSDPERVSVAAQPAGNLAEPDTPTAVMALRRELIAEYKWFGREFLRAQSLSEPALSEAVAKLNRRRYRGDVLRWLADWLDEHPPVTEAATAASTRLLLTVRDAAISYILQDAALWESAGHPYQHREITDITGQLRQQQPSIQMLRLLDTWYERS